MMLYYFLKRGLREWVSYRMALVLGLLNQVVQVTWGFYLATVVQLPASSGYSNYFAFLLVGIVFQRFLHVSIFNYVQTIRNEQLAGTLEFSMLGMERPWEFILLQGSVGYVKTAVLAAVAIAWGVLLGGRFVVNVNTLLSGIVVIVLAMASMMGFGLMAAAVVMVTKRGDPITFTIETLNYLLTGLYYPVTVLPVWLQYIGRAFPLTYAVSASRLVFLRGMSITSPAVLRCAVVMLGFGVVFIPLGMWAFSLGHRRARREGTVSFF